MTLDEFSAFFWQTANALPAEIRNCFGRFLPECIEYELVVNEKVIARAARKLGIEWIPAALNTEDNRWTFAFRPSTLTAPERVLRTIFRHELLHGFVHSVEGMPTPDGAKLFEKFLQRLDPKAPSNYERTENVIRLINEELGGDDKSATEWAMANLRTTS